MDGSNWRWDRDDRPGKSPTSPVPPERTDPFSFGMLLLVAAILVASGYVLTQKLADMERIQDCALQGRTNCAPIMAPEHRVNRR
jgi:hypothetical protein